MKIFYSYFFLTLLFCWQAQAQEKDISSLTDIKSKFEQNINQLETQTLAFVAQWDEIAQQCDLFSSSLFGNMKAPCRSIRAALRRGTLLSYPGQCAQQGFNYFTEVRNMPSMKSAMGEHEEQIHQLLINYEKSLTTVCELNNFLAENPDFSELMIKAKVASPVNFDSFGPMDSMAWWTPQTDQAMTGNAAANNTGTLPAILGSQ